MSPVIPLLLSDISRLQTEREKLLSERIDMQRICVVYYEMANGLNLEMHRQMEISKRLTAILNQVIPFLATEVCVFVHYILR